MPKLESKISPHNLRLCSTASQNCILRILLCAACFGIEGAQASASEFPVHNIQLRAQALSPSKIVGLRRSVSVLSDLESSSDGDLNYFAAHTSHEVLREGVPLLNRHCSTDKALDTGSWDTSRDSFQLYTRLQTRLYPHMLF